MTLSFQHFKCTFCILGIFSKTGKTQVSHQVKMMTWWPGHERWPKWPTDPVPCLAGMPSWTVTTSAIDLQTLGKMEEHCCSLRQSSLTCWGSPKKSTSTPRLRSCREFTESVCRLWRHFWLLWSLPASTAWRCGSGAVRAFSLLWQLRRHCRILGRACPICRTHPFTWCCVCMAKCTLSGQWVLHKE